MIRPMLSIIITTYDLRRRRHLEQVIASLESQNVKDFEFILVVEHSHEMYRYFVAYLKESNLRLSSVIFVGARRGISASRNAGIASAHSEIVAKLDEPREVSCDKSRFDFVFIV